MSQGFQHAIFIALGLIWGALLMIGVQLSEILQAIQAIP